MHGESSFVRPGAWRWTRCGFVVLLSALALGSGCTDDIAGRPQGAAGFTPVSSPAPPPRGLAGVDVCALLTPGDLARLGGIVGAAQRNVLLPQSCGYGLGDGAPGDVVAVAFYKPLDQARAQASHGTLVSTAGYPTWLVCGAENGYQSCSAAVAIHPERTLLVLVSRRDVSEPRVRRDLEDLTRRALARLPAK